MADATTPRVSLCMIVRDERENLSECLQGVAGLFDETIVVDTGSADGTPEAARQLGAQVFEFAWRDDFGAARSEAVSHATGEWIFWLDADDRLDAANRAALQDLLGQLNGTPACYRMFTRSHTDKPWDEPQMLSHIRLFRNHPQARWEGRIHEQILPTLHRLDYDVRSSDIVIDHVGYTDSLIFQRKLRRNLRLLRLSFAENPNDALVLFYLGTTYKWMGQLDMALSYLNRCLQLADRSQDWVRKLYVELARTLACLGNRNEAAEICARGLGLFAGDPELIVLRADLLIELQHLDEARVLLTEGLACQASFKILMGVPEHIQLKNMRVSLARVLGLQQRHRDAERLLQELLADFPDYNWGWVTLGVLYITMGMPAQVDFVAKQLGKTTDGPPFALVMAAQSACMRSDVRTAARLLEQAIGLSPQLPLARMAMAQLTPLITPDPGAHLAAWQELLKVDPSNAIAQHQVAALSRQVPIRAAQPSVV